VKGLVHGLSDTDRRREMDDRLRSAECPAKRFSLLNIRSDELDRTRGDMRGDVRGFGRVPAVNLWIEIVENHDVIAPANQQIDDMGSDEPRTASN